MKTDNIVVLTGAGISAESGLPTFRGEGGLWEGHNVFEVATPEAWERDPAMVLRFYNWRRQQLRKVQPNAAHRALVRLEEVFHVTIVTQNVDDLHERAGSANILHLHGELMKACSTKDPALVHELGDRDIDMGDLCERGSQLRPHVVWFGERVPGIHKAIEIVQSADILLVIGTSLNVYPAASLVPAAVRARRIHVINPEIPAGLLVTEKTVPIRKTACLGVPEVVDALLMQGTA